MKSFTTQVEYEVTNSSSGPSRVRKQIADISLSGLFVRTDELLRAGTRICVRFEVPGSTERVIAVAQCNVPNKGWTGFRFVSLDDEDRELIEAHILSLQSARIPA